MAALPRSPNFAHLRVLRLHSIGDAGLRALAASPHLGRLTTLWVESAQGVADTGMKALARSEYLRCLSYLHLPAALTRQGVHALLEATHIAWPGLAGHSVAPGPLRRQYQTPFDRDYRAEIDWDQPFWSWSS